jgi:glycosyltransferase involved in cell wall biosynthesis
MGLMQFYSWGWILTPLFEPKNTYLPSTKVTVLVPARNEAGNIAQVLACLQAQNYPVELFEILVIDDNSDDGTVTIALSLNVRTLSLRDGLQGKKAAITYGVAQASGDLIITTDADCQMDSDWVSAIVQYYETHNHRIITGPVSFQRVISTKGNRLLYHFQSLDLMGLMFITAGSLRFKFPHMANGANFAFEKKLFNALNGYSGIDNTPTGDDILFLLKANSHYPGCAAFIKSKQAIVSTAPITKWAEFWQQRRRWVSKSDGFGDGRLTAILVFYYLYALLTLGFGLTMFFKPFFVLPFAVLFLGKLVSEVVIMAYSAAFFGKVKEMLWFLPAQIMHVYYVLRIGIEAKMYKYSWKNRMYSGKGKAE